MKTIYNKIKKFIKGKRYEFRIDDNSKVLIISPHPDDESIGMGGFLLKYKSNCEVLLATNGALGNPEWDKDKTIEVRKQEFLDVLDFLGIETYYMLDIMDQELGKNLSRLRQYLTEKYDYIFVPNRHEVSSDHQCLYKYVRRYVRRKRLKCIVVEYEVWTPMRKPNFYLDITEFHEKKERAIQKYESQIKHVKYDWGSSGLNMYRGMLSRSLYSEAYFVNKPVIDKLLEKLKRIKDNINKLRNKK